MSPLLKPETFNERLMNLYAAKSDLESLTDTAVHFAACS